MKPYINYKFWKKREAKPIAFTLINGGMSGYGTLIVATKAKPNQVNKLFDKANQRRKAGF